MFEVHQSDAFAKWFEGLKDRKAAVRIQVRIDRVQYQGHFGDFASVGDLSVATSQLSTLTLLAPSRLQSIGRS